MISWSRFCSFSSPVPRHDMSVKGVSLIIFLFIWAKMIYFGFLTAYGQRAGHVDNENFVSKPYIQISLYTIFLRILCLYVRLRMKFRLLVLNFRYSVHFMLSTWGLHLRISHIFCQPHIPLMKRGKVIIAIVLLETQTLISIFLVPINVSFFH